MWLKLSQDRNENENERGREGMKGQDRQGDRAGSELPGMRNAFEK